MTPSALDLQDLVDRLGGDREATAELIDIFLADAPALVAEIRDAKDDLVRLRRAAHTLKGATGNMGARRACEAAGRLLQAAAAGDAPAAAACRLTLLDEMPRVFDAMEEARVALGRRRAS
jgi:HPt (histidine-containing phosphotransfer) domain-containing protein